MRINEFALGIPTVLLMIGILWANQSHAISDALPEVHTLSFGTDTNLSATDFTPYSDRVEGRSPNAAPGFQDANHNLLNIYKRLNALQGEVQELRGIVEEQNYLVKKLQAENTHENNQSSSNVKQASIKSKATSSGGSSFTFRSSINTKNDSDQNTTGIQAANSQFIPEPILDEKQAYDEAFSTIQSRDYKKAEESLKALLAAYPHGEYAPNAYYWLGEVHSIQGSLDLAKHSFEQVVAKFGFHHKVADAKLKLGFVEHKLGDYKMAKQHLESILAEHPGSATARLAKVRLSEMKNDGVI